MHLYTVFTIFTHVEPVVTPFAHIHVWQCGLL